MLFGLLAPKDLNHLAFTVLSMSVPNEGYFRSAPRALNKISNKIGLIDNLTLKISISNDRYISQNSNITLNQN